VTEVRQGEIFWIDFGTAVGSAPALRHPCVVIQGDLFNSSRIATTVVCLISSNMLLAKAPGNVALRKGDGGLSRASVVNVSQILTVDRAELTDRIGKVSARIIDEIRNGLQLMFERVQG
jgi:mRNA interferase MazF